MLFMDFKWLASMMTNFPKASGWQGALPTGTYFRTPKKNGGIISDCGSFENTGVLTAIKEMDDMLPGLRPKLVVSLIAEDKLHYVKQFFVDQIDILLDATTSFSGLIPFFPEVGRTGNTAVKNHNKIFRLLDIDADGNMLESGPERAAILQECFDAGVCLLPVHVLQNPYWNIIGGWNVWVQFVLQHPTSSLLQAFKSAMPSQVQNELP